MLIGSALLRRLAGVAPRGLAAAGGAPVRAYAEGASAPSGEQQGSTKGLIFDAEGDSDRRNTVVLTGNFGSDLKLSQLPSGTNVASVAMAVTHSKDKTSWFRVEMYSPLAEEATARVGRGSRVTINGFLKEDTWVDKATNSRRSKIKVIAQSLGIVSLRGPNQQDGAGAGASDSAPSAAAA